MQKKRNWWWLKRGLACLRARACLCARVCVCVRETGCEKRGAKKIGTVCNLFPTYYILEQSWRMRVCMGVRACV